MPGPRLTGNRAELGTEAAAGIGNANQLSSTRSYLMTAATIAPRPAHFLAAIALVIAVALPPHGVAAAMVGPDSRLAQELVTGLWLFKGLLAFHAVLAIGIDRWIPKAAIPPAIPERHSWRLAALLMLALALRLPGLNDGLWFDEIQTLVDYVRLPWGVLLATFDDSNQHYLYSIAARAVRSVAGESAASLRLPAVVFGVGSLWAAQRLAQRWMPTREAWWSTAILAVSYHHIWFSQNARGYTGLLLGTVLGTTLFLDILRSRAPTQARVWSYGFTMALAMLTHVTALVVIAGHGVWWLASMHKRAPGLRRFAPLAALLVSGSLTLMLYAPVLTQLPGVLASSGGGSTNAEWQSPIWFVRETVAGLAQGSALVLMALPVAGIVVLLGVVSAWRRDRDACALMTLPVVIMVALLAVTGHNLWPRFFFFVAAFIVQFAVHGGFVALHRAVPRWAERIGNVGLATVTAASLAMLPRAWAPKQDFPAAASYMAMQSRPEDTIVVTDMMALPMLTWLNQPWSVVSDLPQLRAAESPSDATWVLYAFPIRLSVTAPPLWDYLRREYREVHVIPGTVGGGQVVIMRKEGRRAPASQ